MNHELVSYLVSGAMVAFGGMVSFLVKRTFSEFERKIMQLETELSSTRELLHEAMVVIARLEERTKMKVL